MTFEQALGHTGHREEFIRRGREGALQADLYAWLNSLPDLVALCEFPAQLKFIRRKLDCAAPAGGKRPGRRPSQLIVRNGKAH